MPEQKQHTFKIVLTGPESSGKTVLSNELAARINTAWVPEFARYYLEGLGRPYQQNDLQAIGRGQYAWESWFAMRDNRFLICDTDWTVLHIWESVRFGLSSPESWEWQKGYADPKPADLYLLCSPDFPWQPDPLRENSLDRETLFDLYEQLLKKMGVNYTILKGPHTERLQTAISEVNKHFGLLP